MYAADDADPATGRLLADAEAHPHNHYGVYKRANEGNARVYWLDDGVPSIGLRPMTVFGFTTMPPTLCNNRRPGPISTT